MIDLLELDDTLHTLRTELIALGVPKSLVDRVDALHQIIPNIEHAREKRAGRNS